MPGGLLSSRDFRHCYSPARQKPGNSMKARLGAKLLGAKLLGAENYLARESISRRSSVNVILRKGDGSASPELKRHPARRLTQRGITPVIGWQVSGGECGWYVNVEMVKVRIVA